MAISLAGSIQLTGSITGSFFSGSFVGNGSGLTNVPGITPLKYSQFSDSTTQSGSANTAHAIKLSTLDISNDSVFSIVDGSKITANSTGTYNLLFSLQLLQTTNNAADISIWLRKDGTNIPNSNTDLTVEKVAGGGKLVAAWNYIVQLNATQYVELMWSSNRSDTQIAYIAPQTSPTRPATPSAIVSLIQV